MPTTIALRFPAGHYHATPWDKQVNEGVPEWPPAPWRLLRALVAVWKRALPELPEARVRALLGALEAPPSYWLPPAVLAHTRHWMPWDKKGPGDRTLIFDSFLALSPKAALEVTWPGDLEGQQEKDLAALLHNLSYLGRSESWCEARLAAPSQAPNCGPLGPDEKPGEDEDVVRVLAPREPLDFQALLVGTAELRAQRLDPTSPPGSRWVPYVRPAACFAAAAPPAQAPARPRVEVMRFALDAKPLPRVTDAVKVGDLARRSAMSWYGRLNGGGVSPTLAGKDASGGPLQGHRHAHYLPTDEDHDGWLDHLTAWAPDGLDAHEQDALGKVSEQGLRRPGEAPWNLVLVGMGPAREFAAPVLAASKVWISATPFVLTRHPKLRGDTKGGAVPKRVVDGPEDQLRLELSRRGFPEPAKVEPLPRARLRGRELPWLAFYRWRGRGSRVEHACGFRLEFEEPVRGPIALGYGAHYGLGLFLPEAPAGGAPDPRLTG